MIYHDSWIWRFPKISKIGVHCPQSSRIFHCKPSMWRYPHLWKLPYKYISTYINICMYIACVYMNIYIYAHTHIYIYVCVCELKIVTSFEFDVHSHWLSTREAIDSPGGRRSFATCNSVDSFWGAKKKTSSGHITSFCRDAIRMFVKNSGLILAVPMIQIVIHPEFCWVPPPTCGLDQHFTADRFRSQLCGHCTFAVLVFFVSYFGIDIAL